MPFGAVLDGCADSPKWVAAPGLTVTVAVGVIGVPLMVAETVLDSATVELNVPVAIPLELVVLVGWLPVLPDPVAASTTVAPLIGLPFPSRAVTVIVEDPPAVKVSAAAAMDERVGDTPLAVTVTVADCVICVPFTVAETVFASATVELKVPVTNPLAFVGPPG
jgi:hypothetical protein